MARIAGVDLPRNKKIEYALPYIYGIGINISRPISRFKRFDFGLNYNYIEQASFDQTEQNNFHPLFPLLPG